MPQTLMSRYWVNQPSTSQADHQYDGMLVLAPRTITPGEYVDVYPTTGDVYSMRMSSLSLSPGWPKHLHK